MEKKKNKDEYPENVKYPKDEDIYNQEKKETLKEDEQSENEPDDLAADLDIPGTELDDADEMIGREDEENNYYSLGGDNHNDLDED